MRDPAHYLTPLKTTRVPRRLLWLDCHTAELKTRGTWVERWHRGALGTTHYTSRKGQRQDTINTYEHAIDLWLAADRFCTPNRRVVLFTYALDHQLRVSEALVHLPQMGWDIDKIVLERTSSWALFREGSRSLLMCDLRSWSPVDFSRFAQDVLGGGESNREVLAGPDYADQRCRMRVDVIRRAALQIINWIDGENLGGFKPTGSGQSYSAFRRRFLSDHLLVHDDESRLAVERRAMWTGRCEAWRHGMLRDGPYVEYDMQAAYCHIAAECSVPTIALHRGAGTSVDALQRSMEHHAVLADVTVTTNVPCLPCRVGDRTMWPVGTFRTRLWDPELQLAFTYATDIKVHQSWRYQRRHALREFAQWVLDCMEVGDVEYGMVPQRVLKHWSRCLVGRLGLKFRAWEEFGHQDTPDLRLVTFADWDSGTQTDMLIAGRKRMILSDMQESTDSLPQIPGWVMSECRRRLWQVMVHVGLDSVVYVDTDSIVVDPFRAHDLGVFAPHGTLGTWTAKGRYTRMVIHGPRNLEVESTRRVSGLPLTAKQIAPLEFTGEVMRSIKESMRAGELDSVAHIPRKFILDAPDLRREHLPYGATAPFRVNQTTTQEDNL